VSASIPEAEECAGALGGVKANVGFAPVTSTGAHQEDSLEVGRCRAIGGEQTRQLLFTILGCNYYSFKLK
jgi:hypothetical protein